MVGKPLFMRNQRGVRKTGIVIVLGTWYLVLGGGGRSYVEKQSDNGNFSSKSFNELARGI